MRRKTHEEFIEEVREKYGDEYEILGEYVNTMTKILVKHNCKECNYYVWEITPNKLLQGRGCPVCGLERQIKSRTKTHAEFIKEVKEKYGDEYTVLGEYINAKTKILVRHNNCGHEWKVIPNSLLRGTGCPVCSGKEAKLGINTIWDTDKWMVDLGVGEEDAKKYSKGSHRKVVAKCPDCGREKKVLISDLYNNKTIRCTCGDGKSYPEKFVMNVLEQLNVDFETEYSPNWAEHKKFDFCLKDIDCIIETHGEQHYIRKFNISKARTLKEEQQNDKYKKNVALSNGIKYYIELDCRESNIEWIKSSILDSELNELFDLSKVDWLQCAEFANKNIVKEVCEYWNNKREWETTKDLEKKFKLTRTTIIDYLKKGTKLGWCNYNPKEEMRKAVSKNGKSSGKKVEIFKNGKSLGMFPSCTELSRQSEKLFGIKLSTSKISLVCLGEKSQYKGFTFKYVEDNNNSNISKIA